MTLDPSPPAGPGLHLTGGLRLAPGGLVPGTVTLRAGRFCPPDAAPAPGDRVLAVDGLALLPGLVDLHGDGFERHLAPRRGMVSDLARGLDAVEAELATCGITTAWLAQFWSWEGGMRGPDFARRLAAALAGGRDPRRPGRRLDLRMQLRLETHMTDDAAALRALITEHGIDYVVLNDHLPHRALALGRTPPRLTGSALKAGRSPAAHLAEMQARAARAPGVPEFIAALARDLAPRGVRLGSHDDACGAARARLGDLGFAICEFPLTGDAARAARARGEPVIMGAPNVLRGGSHAKGVSAEALVAEGLVDALASDYHYPALAQAAFALADRGVLPLARAWALVSSGPAAIMGLADRGRIAEGARADLVVLDPALRRVLGVFAAGRPVHLAGALADALLSPDA